MDKKASLYNIDASELVWRKSTFTVDNQECVELAPLPDGGFAVRDTKNRERGFLAFNAAEKAAFLAGLRAGEFEDILG